MIWTRWLRAALIGLAVAEGVALAAGGPRWRSASLDGATLLGYGPDGRECYTFRDADWRAWDARTGANRARPLDLPPVSPNEYRTATLTADGTWLLVADFAVQSSRFDTLVAARRFATTADRSEPWPQPAEHEPGFGQRSSDGRWLCRPQTDHWPPSEFEFLALPAMTPVTRVTDATGVVFAADRPEVAVVRRSPTAGRAWAVDRLDFRTGRERRLPLPPARGIWHPYSLHGDRLLAVDVPDVLSDHGDLFAFDLGTDPPTAGRLLTVPRDDEHRAFKLSAGPGWLALVATDTRPPTVFDRGLLWLRDRTGGTTPTRPQGQSHVALYDAAGRSRSTLPGRLPANVVVAPDGTSVAAVDDHGRLAVWAADPPAPLPRAVAAGLLTAAAWVWVERWRAAVLGLRWSPAFRRSSFADKTA